MLEFVQWFRGWAIYEYQSGGLTAFHRSGEWFSAYTVAEIKAKILEGRV